MSPYRRERRAGVTPLHNATAQWIDNNADAIVDLIPCPDSGEPWDVCVADTPLDGDAHRALIQRAHRYRLIEKVGKRTTPGRDIYETNEEYWQRAQYRVDNRTSPTLPCGHLGTRTVSSDPPTYECGEDHCSEQFGREEAMSSLGLSGSDSDSDSE